MSGMGKSRKGGKCWFGPGQVQNAELLGQSPWLPEKTQCLHQGQWFFDGELGHFPGLFSVTRTPHPSGLKPQAWLLHYQFVQLRPRKKAVLKYKSDSGGTGSSIHDLTDVQTLCTFSNSDSVVRVSPLVPAPTTVLKMDVGWIVSSIKIGWSPHPYSLWMWPYLEIGSLQMYSS